MRIPLFTLFLFSCTGQGHLRAGELPVPATVAALLAPALADGFDDPIAGGDPRSRPRNRSVTAIGAGTVWKIEPWDGAESGASRVWVQHRFVENGQIREVWSGTAPLIGVNWETGAKLKRKEILGTLSLERDLEVQICLEAPRSAESPPASLPVSGFVQERRSLLVPAREELILIVVKSEHQLHLCRQGKLAASYYIALGQDPAGPKLADGDNKTPEGEYRILQKAIGPFDGEWGAYLGSRWIRLSYPNAFDARRALAEGRISEETCQSLVRAAAKGTSPSRNTSLGGGIGIHGWISDWSIDDPTQLNLTFGCLSLRQADLAALYPEVAVGTRVILHP